MYSRPKNVNINGWITKEKAEFFDQTHHLYYRRPRPLRQEERPKEKKCLYVSVPGWKFIIDKKNPRYIRIMWFLLILISIAAVSYQLVLNLLSFLKQPVGISLDVEQMSEIELPKLLLCPAVFYHFYADNFQQFEKLKSVLELMGIDKIWSLVEMPEVEIYPSCIITRSYFNKEFECKQLKYSKTDVINFFGTCHVISFEETLPFLGVYTSFHIFLKDKKADFFTDGLNQSAVQLDFLFGIYSNDEYFPSKVTVMNMHNADNTVFVVTFYKYFHINKRNKKCGDSESVATCVNDCKTKVIEEVVNCGLPFINSSKPKCKVAEGAAALERIFKMHLKTNVFAQCETKCPQKCNITKYNLYNYRYNHSYASVQTFFDENRIFTFKEQLAYPTLQFLSDVGGLLNLTAGFCILAVLSDICNVFVTFLNPTKYSKLF